MQYAVVIEKAENNYSAYVPDLPGCITTGATIDEIKQLIREAIEFHLDGMIEEGLPIPEPTTVTDKVEVEISHDVDQSGPEAEVVEISHDLDQSESESVSVH